MGKASGVIVTVLCRQYKYIFVPVPILALRSSLPCEPALLRILDYYLLS